MCGKLTATSPIFKKNKSATNNNTLQKFNFYMEEIKETVISKNITSIDEYAFEGCEALEKITVDKDNRHYLSIDGNLYNKDATDLIQYAPGKKDTSFVIPNSVAHICPFAFSCCKNLTAVTIPEGVKLIGKGAFEFCVSIRHMTIGNAVEIIEAGAFYWCKSLTTVTIPKSVKQIEHFTFEDCDNLTDIYYLGTKNEWYKIKLGNRNNPLLKARMHYSECSLNEV